MRACLTLLTLAFTALVPVPGLAAPHWAFQPPKRPRTPAVARKDWARNPVDSFILARLERAGLTPAPPAGRATLLRRVTYDLTGLPPTPRELADFLADQRPDAYERVVERLLASPHFGERWAQHWLDVVRYAESNGYEADALRPQAFCYRDYVVAAFNADTGFDRFVTEQLAGDLLVPPAARRGVDGADRPEARLLIAAGFNRCGPVHQVGGNVDPLVSRQEVLTEMTQSVGSAFLGLTVGCARCHDHKFDPIPQKDYYRLQAFFSAAYAKEIDLATSAELAAHERQSRALEARLAPLRKQVAELDAPYRRRLEEAKKARLEAPIREALVVEPGKRTPRQRQLVAEAQPLLKVTWDEIIAALTPADRTRRADLRRQIHALEARRPPPLARAWTITEGDGPRFAHVLKRGDPHRKGARVVPGFLSALPGGADTPADRVALARWLTRPDHPLTARVIVNRLWQHHFGHGLVRTPNDFGRRGAAPTHPELLDMLARELVEHGWSLKHLHRLMVLSSAYRQASRPADPRARRIDPDNRLLWRMNRRRRDGEGLRDSILAVAGTLERRLGGPMVRVPLEPEVYELIFTEGEPDGLWPVTPDPRQHTRRSLYLFNKRNLRLPLLEAFDQPDTLTSCPVRAVSTFAPQALILLNSPFLQQQSRAFAVRLLREAGPTNAARIDHAYRLALARPPRPNERRTALAFLDAQATFLRDRIRRHQAVVLPPDLPLGSDPAVAAALADFCLALLNRNEFLYLD